MNRELRSDEILTNLRKDVELVKALLPEADGSVEIYVITFKDESGLFYIGQHQLRDGKETDPEYLGSGRQLNELPKETRVKEQLLRTSRRWADLVEELLVEKYRGLAKHFCLNSSPRQIKGVQARRSFWEGYYRHG